MRSLVFIDLIGLERMFPRIDPAAHNSRLVQLSSQLRVDERPIQFFSPLAIPTAPLQVASDTRIPLQSVQLVLAPTPASTHILEG
jgi:hypothetical protein